jgi:hypothetical protein
MPSVERRYRDLFQPLAATTTEASTVPRGRSLYSHTSSARRTQSIEATGSGTRLPPRQISEEAHLRLGPQTRSHQICDFGDAQNRNQHRPSVGAGRIGHRSRGPRSITDGSSGRSTARA